MLATTARNLIAAAAIGLAIGGAAAPIGVAEARGGGGHGGGHSEGHSEGHSTPGQRTGFTSDETRRAGFTSKTERESTSDETETGCHKYTPDSPQYTDCMAQ